MIEPIEMNVDFSTQDTEINVEADMNCKVEIPLPIASATTLGGIKVGENLSITEDGTLSADANADDVDQLKNALTAVEIVDSASGTIASFADGSDGVPVKGLKVQLEPIQAGSGDPSPTNIRPISGRDSVTVTRTGKNLLSGLVQGGINTQGDLAPSVTNRISSADFIPIKPGETYTISGSTTVSESSVEAYVLEFSTNGGTDYVKTEWWTSLPKTFTAVSSAKYIKVMFRLNNNSDFTPANIQNAQIEVGSIASSYESFKAIDVYPITFPTEAGTVYGGTLDVTNGLLTVDRTSLTLDGSENWQVNTATNGLYYLVLEDILLSTDEGMFSNEFTLTKVSGVDMVDGQMKKPFNTQNVNFKYSPAATLNAWKEWVMANPIQIVFPLATPITVQITPQQMTTILGQNNVWSYADSVSVDYVADTKLYIEQLTEPDSDMVADMNITSGRYFMVGNSLYLATASIANGAAIVVGVNCTRTSLAEALNAINS